jgi:Protein of unknown function, DUF488
MPQRFLLYPETLAGFVLLKKNTLWKRKEFLRFPLSGWRLRPARGRIMKKQSPLLVLMEDEPIHTEERPLCDDPTCPCHDFVAEAAPSLVMGAAHSPIIYTLGYRQANAEEQLAQLTAQGMPIVDIRYRASSPLLPQYHASRLLSRFGARYHRVRELGNRNYRHPDAPIVLADAEKGIAKVLGLLHESAQARGIILLCACEHWKNCHRSRVADLLLRQMPGASVIHLESGGSGTVLSTPMPLLPRQDARTA